LRILPAAMSLIFDSLRGGNSGAVPK
jgi:hypothetical protein